MSKRKIVDSSVFFFCYPTNSVCSNINMFVEIYVEPTISIAPNWSYTTSYLEGCVTTVGLKMRELA